MGKLLLALLPGLDGTGDLFRPLLDVMPSEVDCRVVSYPTDRRLSYDDLMPVVSAQLPRDRPLVLLAESFSGPLALRHAAAHPAQVRAVVLCASFVRPPLPAWVRHVVRPVLFRLPPPAAALRLLLVGQPAPGRLTKAVRAAIRRVRPGVLAHRVREVLAVDCTDALARCAAPILYLQAAQDALVGRKAVTHITAVRGDVIVRTLPGPHLLLQAAPAVAWASISDFLLPHGWGG